MSNNKIFYIKTKLESENQSNKKDNISIIYLSFKNFIKELYDCIHNKNKNSIFYEIFNKNKRNF